MGPRRDDSRSDLFSVRYPEQQVIAPLPSKLPPTPEERRRKLLIIVGSVVLVVASVAGAWWVWQRDRFRTELDDATARALEDGLGASIDGALHIAERSDDDRTRASRALLESVNVLERARPAAPVSALIQGLPHDAADTPDVSIAMTYLLLATGHPREAARTASKIQPSAGGGARLAEAERALALTALANGDVARALTHARAAAVAAPRSPRHHALLAIVGARSGDSAGALRMLASLQGAAGAPSVHVARARVLEASGELGRARNEAEIVLGRLAGLASPPEKAWAHLVRASWALGDGEIARALEDAATAESARPTSDEAFDLTMLEVRLRAGDTARARTVLDRLPREGGTDPSRRGLVRAELALAQADAAAAEAALHDATPSARSDLDRARLAELRGDRDAARQGYVAASREPTLFVESRWRLAALELAADDSGRAVAAVDEALARAPLDLRALPIGVRAHVARGDVSGAAALVARGLARHPDAVPLLAARGEVELARGELPAALATLGSVVARAPDDADVHYRLGLAQLGSGALDEAATSFQATLRLAPARSDARVGLLRIAVARRDPVAAAQALAEAERATASGLDFDVARARARVLAGAGEAAIRETRAAASRAPTVAGLLVSLAQLQEQAERLHDALETWQRAHGVDAADPVPLVGVALMFARLGLKPLAEDAIDTADDALHGQRASPLSARLRVARGWVAFRSRSTFGALSNARLALRDDADCAEAHLLLATLAEDGNRDPVSELRAAGAAIPPMPEAWGRLAIALSATSTTEPVPPAQTAEACTLAARYAPAAPRGSRATAVRALLRTCPH